MNSHKNARLTHHRRAKLAQRVLVEGQTASQVATSFGICVKTPYVVYWRRNEAVQPDQQGQRAA